MDLEYNSKIQPFVLLKLNGKDKVEKITILEVYKKKMLGDGAIEEVKKLFPSLLNFKVARLSTTENIITNIIILVR